MDGLEHMARALPPLSGRLLLGLSGGADSVALLRLLLVLRDAGEIHLEAAHVNHALRAEESDADEAFVRSLCRRFDVPLHCFRAVPPEHPGEDWARRVRYGFFRDAMAQHGMDALVLAHHRFDQAETLMLHLLRGAGLNGLCAMREDACQGGMRILRPLLRFGRGELRALLRDLGQDWREDSSNQDGRYLRNAVRHELLPLMERLAPGAEMRLAATASLLQEDAEFLFDAAEELLARAAHGRCLRLELLCEQPPGLRRHALRLWWQREGAPGLPERSLTQMQTAALCALADAGAGARCNLPGAWHAFRGWRYLHLVPGDAPPPAAPVPLGDTGAALDGVTLHILPPQPDPGDGKRCQQLPCAMLRGCVLRHRRTGDWIRPFGCAGRQSLQDYLVNRRVDAPFRDALPLLCRGGEVLLVGGVGAGNVPRARADEECVRLVFDGDMPWME